MEPIDIIDIDSKRMFILFQEIFKKICGVYGYNYNEKEKFDIHLNKFENSLLKKILLLSQDILLGSLMTNMTKLLDIKITLILCMMKKKFI